VAEEYKLQTETLYLAVAYIDRFLSYMSVQRSKLQLVGTACMFIAAKYEEIYPPDVGEFVYITDDTYNKRQVLRMEHLVLKVLGFDLSGPSANVFLSQMSELSKTDEKTKHLAMFLCELSLLHGDTFLKFSPSLMAASSLALARHSLGSSGDEVWTKDLASFTGYQVDTSASVSWLFTPSGELPPPAHSRPSTRSTRAPSITQCQISRPLLSSTDQHHQLQQLGDSKFSINCTFRMSSVGNLKGKSVF